MDRYAAGLYIFSSAFLSRLRSNKTTSYTGNSKWGLSFPIKNMVKSRLRFGHFEILGFKFGEKWKGSLGFELNLGWDNTVCTHPLQNHCKNNCFNNCNNCLRTYLGAFFWGYSGYSYTGFGIIEYTEFQFRKERSYINHWQIRNFGSLFPFQFFEPEASRDQRGWPRKISRQKFPKPHSFHSVHSAIGSRMNGISFRSFRKRNNSQKNTNTAYAEYMYFYSGIVPKEPALNLNTVSIHIQICSS